MVCVCAARDSDASVLKHWRVRSRNSDAAVGLCVFCCVVVVVVVATQRNAIVKLRSATHAFGVGIRGNGDNGEEQQQRHTPVLERRRRVNAFCVRVLGGLALNVCEYSF